MIEKRAVARVRVELRASAQLEQELSNLFEQPPSGGIQLHTVDERYLDLGGYQASRYTTELKAANRKLGRIAHESLSLTGLSNLVDDPYGPMLYFEPDGENQKQFDMIKEALNEIPSLVRPELSELLCVQIGRRALVHNDKRRHSVGLQVVDNLKRPTKIPSISVRGPRLSVTELHNFRLQDPTELPVR